MKRLIRQALVVCAVVGLCSSVARAEVKKVTYETVTKTLVGKVAAISPTMLALVHGQDAKKKSSLELPLRMNKAVKIEGKNGTKKIDPWETVSVVYDETSEIRENELGVRSTKVKERLVKSITYIAPAPDFAAMKTAGR